MNDEDPLYTNLNLRETDDLLDIWKHGDPDEWQEDVFDLIGEILQERLGYLPDPSIKLQVKQRMEVVESWWDAGELEKAREGVEWVLQIQPGLAEAHHLRGLVLAEMGDMPQAAEAYKTALQLDPRLSEAREDLLDLDEAFEDQFLSSPAMQHLNQAREFARKGLLDQAQAECDLARQTLPETASAHNELGEVLDECGQSVEAIQEYQKALALNPEHVQAGNNLRDVEADLEEEFLDSTAIRQLDQALEDTYNDEPERALEACNQARESLPPIALAHNYLGLILAELEQWESAAEAFRQAIQFNPRFFAARQNLADAQLRLEDEDYRLAAWLEPEDVPPSTSAIEELGEYWQENPIPGWMYQNRASQLVSGWPGYRTRHGRSGYDPLDSDFEDAHILGIILRRIFTLKMRTRNPLYLLGMTAVGLIYCLPLVGLIAAVQGDPITSITVLSVDLYWILGIGLLVNVIASLRAVFTGEDDGTGHDFF